IDIIISNPPYIREDDFNGLPREVREHEPRMALVAGKTGLEVYEKILALAAAYLTTESQAYIVLETDPIVSGGLLELVEGSIDLGQALLEKDYNKKDRVIIANRSL
ncbi:MAG: peptide chain release factor N(5)-glutamine methyltransferase, partial [Candidatus Humimicrobiaceae bacterium]